MKQVGGDHYESDYQHWDWAIDCGLGPLEYGATRYVVRHRKKNGKQDLEKAIHFVEKLISVAHNYQEQYSWARPDNPEYWLSNFSSSNKLTDTERLICCALSTWKDVYGLQYALTLLNELKAAYTDVPSAQAGQGVAGVAHRAGWPISDAPVAAGGGAKYTEHPAPFGYSAEEDA